MIGATEKHAVKHTNKPNRRAWALAIAALLVIASAAGLWVVKETDPNGPSILPPCLFYQFTGLYCTGCGITRALHLILNGHFYAGFRMNPLAVISLPFLVVLLVVVLLRLWKDRPLPNMPLWVPWAALAVIVLFMVARNLPWEPFSWLAPTEIPWVR